jgi:hypothetical protein
METREAPVAQHSSPVAAQTAEDVGDVKYDLILKTEIYVQITQPEVHIDHDDLYAPFREDSAEIYREYRLAYASLSGCGYNYFTQRISFN